MGSNLGITKEIERYINNHSLKLNTIQEEIISYNNKLGDIKFYSATYRLFKLPNLLESDCEDYGQAVIYKGTIPHHKNFWMLDNHHSASGCSVTRIGQA